MKIRYKDGSTADVELDRARGAVESGEAVALDEIAEVPSRLVTEAEARKEYAKTEYATPQEKRQAKVEEEADARGDNARLHTADVPAVAVPDETESEAKKAATDSEELFRNKGPVETRPDSAGVKGLPKEAIGASSPAADAPAPVKAAAKK